MVESIPSMKGKVCLVTGASSGVGLETAKTLAAAGAEVAIVGRDADRSLKAAKHVRGARKGSDVRLYLADLSDMDAVRTLAKQVRKDLKRLDVLVNNAAILTSERRVTKQGYEATFATNYLSHFLLTNELVPMMRRSAPGRIINLMSGLHDRGQLDFEDLHLEKRYNGWKAYANSKLAMMVFTTELSRRLLGSAVTANAVFPGMVRTRWARDVNLGGKLVYLASWPFSKSARKGARPVVWAATDPSLQRVSGQYFAGLKLGKPADGSDDQQLGRRLWEESERLTSLA